MYLTGIIHIADLNRFLSLQTIQELELDTTGNFFVDDIDEDDTWKDSEPGLEAPAFIPPSFSSMLFAPFSDMFKTSRPITHELVSPLDEAMPSTGSRNISGVAWPTEIPVAKDSLAYSDIGQPTLTTVQEDEEDRWVDFATVQRQLKLEATLDPDIQNDDLEFLGWGPLDDPFVDEKNMSMGLRPVRIPRPIWPHGPRVAARV